MQQTVKAYPLKLAREYLPSPPLTWVALSFNLKIEIPLKPYGTTRKITDPLYS
jgi:hypothetical protein